jgi:hypothetical protein
MAQIDDMIRNPERYEERVTLVAPTAVTADDPTLGVRWEDGRAQVPRSVAERMVDQMPHYAIEESS